MKNILISAVIILSTCSVAMSEEQILKNLNFVNANNKFEQMYESLSPDPRIALWLHYNEPTIKDRFKKDPFTNEEKYEASAVYCHAELYLANIQDHRIFTKSDPESSTPNVITLIVRKGDGKSMGFNFWTGRMLEGKRTENDSTIFDGQTITSYDSGVSFPTRDEAEDAAQKICMFEEIQRVDVLASDFLIDEKDGPQRIENIYYVRVYN